MFWKCSLSYNGVVENKCGMDYLLCINKVMTILLTKASLKCQDLKITRHLVISMFRYM